VLELNEPATDVAESNDEAEPTGRRIDDILTTADTFNVAGFGEVRFARGLPTLTSSHAREPSVPAAHGHGASRHRHSRT